MNKQIAASVAVVGLAATAALFNMSSQDTQLYMRSQAPISQGIISEAEQQFFGFIAKHNKFYGTKQEYQFRLELFSKNLEIIKEWNSNENHTSTIGVNKFSDWTEAEKKSLNGYKAEAKVQNNVKIFDTENIEESIDWRTLGAVTYVKDQGQCGSCWAFSSTGSLEGAHFLATGNLVALSEQNLVDCSWLNHGCNGGLMDFAFRYAESHPLQTENDYPYKAKTSLFACSYDKSKGVVQVKSYSDVTSKSPDQLKAALNKGPVSVAIEADKAVFQQYTGGIISGKDCGTSLDHGVLAVGYGSENGQEYFIVKNSWGSNWGDNGFVKLAIEDGAGVCGIQMQPSIPSTN